MKAAVPIASIWLTEGREEDEAPVLLREPAAPVWGGGDAHVDHTRIGLLALMREGW